MNILIFLLSFILVLACLFLILLVLVQLPKKEAGLGQAFGAGATDALFGPGSGNMLTKLTKWTAGIFFALTLLIWMLQGHSARAKIIDPRAKLTAAEKAGEPAPAQPAAGTNAPPTNPPPAAPASVPAATPPANTPAPNTPATPVPAPPK